MNELKAVINGQEYVWNVEITGSDLVIEAARKGFQEWLNDAASTASATDADTEADSRLTDKELDPQGYKEAMLPIRQKAVEARLAKILDGTYSPGSRGSSTQFTSEQDKIKGYIETLGFKWPRLETSGKTKNGKPKTAAADFETGWKAYTESIAKKNNKKWDEKFQKTIYQHVLKLVNPDLDGLSL
jgi:hypothetical protein